VDDFQVCSDLCEENGFPRQAGMLRSLAEGGGRAYLVVERGYGYNDEHDYIDPSPGEPRNIFFDREEAEREANALNAQWLREVSIASFGWFNLGSSDEDDDPRNAPEGADKDYDRDRDYDRLEEELGLRGTDKDYDQSEEGLARRVGEVLGQEFHRADFYEPLGQLPGPPTDEQILRLARFLNAEFYYVVETEFAV
jgi:hypothetical protein